MMFDKISLHLLLSALVLTSMPPSDPSQMRSNEFDSWITQQMSDSSQSDFCRYVLDRLKAERRTSRLSVMKCVEKVASPNPREKSTKSTAQRTASFIDEILTNVGEDKQLTVELIRRKGNLLIAANDFGGASAQFEMALKYSDPGRLDADWLHEATLVNLGQALASAGKQEEAEGYYLLALSYPWYTIVKDAEELQRFRDLYIQAGRGLIDVRRNKLEQLKAITFVPAAMNELGPALDGAIKQASR